MRIFQRVLLLSVLVASMVGCGGGGGGGTPEPEPSTPVKFGIGWGARSKVIEAPSSALSATLTLTGANSQGGDLVATVNRHANAAAYDETYTSAVSSKLGSFPMTVRFYSLAGGAGTVVASGSATVTIAADGSGIGNVVVDNKVASVAVDPYQALAPGETRLLTFTARDSDGAIVAVTPDSALWDIPVISGAQLAVDGTATGISPGRSDILVSVDGVTSPTVYLWVTAKGFPNSDFALPAILTGSFREPAPLTSNWTGTGSYGMSGSNSIWGASAHSGFGFGFVHQGGTLEQTLSHLQVGKNYRVSLWIARRNGNPGGGNAGEPVSVEANGTEVLAPTIPTGDATWTQVSSTFSVTNSLVRFVIKGHGTSAVNTATLIDDVVLEQVD